MPNDFVGGPYDGLRLDDFELSGLTTLVAVRTDRGIRVFSLLPPLREWDRVAAGGRPAAAAGYPYELILTADAGAFHDAVENGAFDRAVAEGRVG